MIGGLKCGTTSLHHYLNLHPEIAMSRPKELNFFVAELNWELGVDWYRAHFPAGAAVRGETSPHYTNRPRFEGVAERMRETLGADARVIYMVRHPIDRLLSHYLHNVGGGYESARARGRRRRRRARPTSSAASTRSSSSRTSRRSAPTASWSSAREELARERDATVRRVFEFAGVDPGFTSPEFDREWETGSGKGSGGFRLMDRAVRLPGLRALDRNFDRLPERMRWLVERVVHDPGSGEAPKPELEPELRGGAGRALSATDTARLEETDRPQLRLGSVAMPNPASRAHADRSGS